MNCAEWRAEAAGGSTQSSRADETTAGGLELVFGENPLFPKRHELGQLRRYFVIAAGSRGLCRARLGVSLGRGGGRGLRFGRCGRRRRFSLGRWRGLAAALAVVGLAHQVL